MNIFRQPIEGTAKDWPIDTKYEDTVHGQKVTVTRFAPGWRCEPLSEGPEYTEVRIGGAVIGITSHEVTL